VRVTTVSGDSLRRQRVRASRAEFENRAVLGLSIGITGSRRDTLGPMVMRVTTDGPAERAGIVEGDRIAAINGVDLRVPREDAGDSYIASARANRFRRELDKLEPGAAVELRIVTGGQPRTVRVTTVSADSLPRDRQGFMYFGDGPAYIGDIGTFIAPRVRVAPMAPISPMAPMAPRAPRAPRIYHFDDDLGHELRFRIERDALRDAQGQTREALERAREALHRALESRWWVDDIVEDALDEAGKAIERDVKPAVRDALRTRRLTSMD
jgi:hypothetical protein